MHVAINPHRLADSAGPERKMWAYVLRQAIYDLSSPHRQAQAAAWFGSDSEDPFTFLWVCDALRLSPGKALAKVREVLAGAHRQPAVSRLRHAGAS